MKTILVSFLLVFLTACSVVPVKRKFPEAPEVLLKTCEDLKTIQGDKIAITDMLKTIVENYRMYYECSNKVEGWQDWYKDQKQIFDSVK